MRLKSRCHTWPQLISAVSSTRSVLRSKRGWDMKPVELVAPLAALRESLGDDRAAAMDAIIDVVTRFGESDVADFVAKLAKVKPTAHRSTSVAKARKAAKKVTTLTDELIAQYSTRL